jgi:hypothetical protein
MKSDKRSSFEGMRYGGDLHEVDRKIIDKNNLTLKAWDGASKEFQTKTWDGSKSFSKDKLNTPEFITRAKGIQTEEWKDSSKAYNTSRSDFEGQQWADGHKQVSVYTNSDIEKKRESTEKPSIMSLKEYQQKTIEETRTIMGR